MAPITTKENVAEAAEFIRTRTGVPAGATALVLGSGFGGLAASIADAVEIPYADVPHMPRSTAPGHAGRFVVGTLEGKPVVCMQGRLHAYEGYTADQIGFPVYVLHELGVSALVLTNAAGGINADFGVGDLMLIDDHVNFLGMDPCLGPDQPDLRPRFFDMTYAYDRDLREKALAAAGQCGIALRRGVYIAEPGPSFETPAEIRAFRALGADAVGMSTVLETIAARSVDLPVLGFSLISNPAAGVLDAPLEMDDVEKAAARAAGQMERLLRQLLRD